MGHILNPSTKEAEAGGSLWVRGQLIVQSEFQSQLGLHNEILFQNIYLFVCVCARARARACMCHTAGNFPSTRSPLTRQPPLTSNKVYLLFTSFYILFAYLSCVLQQGMVMPWRRCGGQRTTGRAWYNGTQVVSLIGTASAHWAILPASSYTPYK